MRIKPKSRKYDDDKTGIFLTKTKIYFDNFTVFQSGIVSKVHGMKCEH